MNGFININYDEFSLLEFGDIVWAKRCDDNNLLDVPEGHREGPYIVIGKDDNGVKCLYGTSIMTYCNRYRTLILDAAVYSLSKVTYINTSNYEILKRERFIKKVSFLTEEDKKRLCKKLFTAIECGLYSGIEVPSIPLECGDVISDGRDLYLIIEDNTESVSALKLLDENNGINCYLELNGKRYYLDFDNIVNFNKNDDVKRCNFIDKYDLNKIVMLQKQRLESFMHKVEISRGSLIKKNNNYYYIYGELGNEWMVFSLYESNYSDLCRIMIGNKCFYTNFSDTINITKDSNFEFVGKASEKEIDNIKKKKKAYFKNEKTKEKKKSNLNKSISVDAGDIVEFFVNNVPVLYVVILKNEEEVLGIKYSKYINGIYEFNNFPINNIKKIGTMEKKTLKDILVNVRDKTSDYINENTLKRLVKQIED